MADRNGGHETVIIQDLTFTVRRGSRRTSVGIIIDRMGELILAVPVDCSHETMEQVAREKYRWITTKLTQKELLFRPPPVKRFVDGEGFHYLGRSYRLRLVRNTVDNVDTVERPILALERGWFYLRAEEVERGEQHFIAWYRERGMEWLPQRIQAYTDRIGVHPRGIVIRPLGFRWGSCGRNEILYFHWRIMMLPVSIIDYIVVHELVHLHEPRHNKTFWQRIERAMPDYLERKRWLAENGSWF
jgi:predicted metal-dependent hydrolase